MNGHCRALLRFPLTFIFAVSLFLLVLPADSRWLQQDHLFADDAAANDEFGRSVAIDGDTVVVGAAFDDTAAGSDAGSAYVFTRSGTTWLQQDHLFADDAAADDEFGHSVAIGGDTVVVGVPLDDTAAGQNAGSAYVFLRVDPFGVWAQVDQLFADDAAVNDHFGTSVAIDNDNIVVGAAHDDTAAGTAAGSAYVFTLTGSAWSQQDHLVADDAAVGDRFGESVAIDGDTIVVGAAHDDTAAGTAAGSAYVFTRTGATWSQQDHVFADDAAADDEFGHSVAIGGDTVVVGVPLDDTAAGKYAGSAYVFTRTGSTWSQQDHLFADDAAASEDFGQSVAIDGDTIVVGAWWDDTAAGTAAGSAYVFTRTGATWSQQDHLFADDAAAFDNFGTSVAIDGDTIVVGAMWDATTTWFPAGSAYVFLSRRLGFFIAEPETPREHYWFVPDRVP